MRKIKKSIITISIIIFILFATIAYAIYLAFYDIQRIDEQKYIYNIQRLNGQQYINEITSPDGTYTVTAYLNNGGATTSYAVLGTLKNNITNKTKNIYWQYPCDKADIQWINDNTIKINEIQLQVESEIYDYRKN